MLRKIKIAIAVIACYTCAAYSGQWQRITPSMYAVNDAGGAGYALVMSVRDDNKKVRSHFVSVNDSLCSVNPHGNKGEVGPYKVNGEFLRFRGICLQGILWILPITPEADAYLLRSVRQGQVVTLEVDSGAKVVFETSGVAEIDKALEQAKRAL